MAELSHRALRELIEGFGGCDEYYTEMISAAGLLGGGPFERWYLDALPCPERVVYQLAGANAEQLTAAAALLDRRDCGGIDLNMGCSAPAITRTGAGVRWMEDIDRAGALAGRVRGAVKKRLSVKLRLGPAASAPGPRAFEYLLRFCLRLQAEGVERIALHPRTGGEKFRRRARWEYVDRLQAALDIPVAGNGDIASAEDLIRRAGAVPGGVMAGRGAVRRPWLFAEARRLAGEGGLRPLEPEPDIEETGLRFLDLLARRQPPEFHLSRARRFFGYYCDNLIWGNYLKTLLNRETDLGGMAAVWRSYFREHGEERMRAPAGAVPAAL